KFAEEAFHWRARLERRIIVIVALRDLLVEVDLDGNDRRLHALDDVSEANGLLDLANLIGNLRMCRTGKPVRADRRAKAIGDNPNSRDHGSHQCDLAGGEQRTARLPRGWEGRKIERSFGHQSYLQGQKSVQESVGGGALAPFIGEHGGCRLTKRWRRH